MATAPTWRQKVYAGIFKIAYYDLKLEALNGRLENIVGRHDEMSRMGRVLGRRIHNNCLIVGSSGVGKTSLVLGWIKQISGTPAAKLPPLSRCQRKVLTL